MAAGATCFEMCFVVRLHCVAFGASLADPLLVTAVFSSEMLLYANEITQSMARVMVQASGLRANEDSLLHQRSLPLQELPGHLVAAAVHLKVLVPLESLVADLTDITI